MAIENILMPQLGESVTEGTIEKWLVKPGDTVNKYDPLAEVNTDKVTAEVPSSFTGIIQELIAQEGEALAVGSIICTIEIEGAGTPEKAEAACKGTGKRNAGSTDRGTIMPVKREKGRLLVGTLLQCSVWLKTTASIYRLLKGRDVKDESRVKIYLQSSRAAISQLPRQFLLQTRLHHLLPAPAAPAEKIDVPVAVGDIEIPVTGVRRAIASNMLRSKHEAPHAWTMIEVDVTNLVQYRDSLKNDFKKKEGFNLTYYAFFVKAVSQALKEFPMMNSMWAGDKIIQKKDINISIPVATEDALYVPVISNADEKTIKGIGREMQELARKSGPVN